MYSGDFDFKEEYLNELKNNYDSEKTTATRRQTDILFRNRTLQFYEQQLKKDLYDFTEDEIKELLGAFLKTEIDSLRPDLVLIKKYSETAIDKGRSIFNISPCINIFPSDLANLVNKSQQKKKYITKNELRDYLTKKDSNGQDVIEFCQEKTPAILIYNGILGKDYFDILNLKKSDFNYDTKTIEYFESETNKIKVIKLDDWEAEIIQSAIYEESYLTNTSVANRFHKYVESEYILKRKNFSKSTETITAPLLFGIIKKNSLDINFKKHWNITNIYTSGLIYNITTKENLNWKIRGAVSSYLKDNNINITTARIVNGLKIMEEKIKIENTKE